MECHREGKGADDTREREYLISLQKVKPCYDRDHRDHVHDADGRSSYKDISQIMGAGRKDKAAVLECREARSNADGRKTKLVVGRFEDIKAEQHRHELHDLFNDRRQEDRHVVGVVSGHELQEASDICGKKADQHARKERDGHSSRAVSGEQDRYRERNCYAKEDVLSIYHGLWSPF